jgi:hypothetical protein
MRWSIVVKRTTALRLAASCWCRVSMIQAMLRANAELVKQRHRCQQCIEDRRCRRGSKLSRKPEETAGNNAEARRVASVQ